MGTRLSTEVTNGLAAHPRDRNPLHIASASSPATVRSGAKAKTLDPEPQRAKPGAPVFRPADRASAYPGRNGAPTGSAHRSPRPRAARARPPHGNARARTPALAHL